MKYLVAGMTITNDIIYADGRRSDKHLGGAIFSLEGARTYTDDLLYVSCVGDDFEEYYGEWMDNNKMKRDGLRFSLPHTHYNIVEFHPDDTYHEYSIYGDTYIADHIPQFEITADHVLSVSKGAEGMYIDSKIHEKIFEGDGIEQIRDGGTKIMWEITTGDLMDPSKKEKVLEYIQRMDIFTLNKPESFCFFGVDNEEDAIKEIKKLGKPCYYRVGSKGSYMISGGEHAFAPSIDIGVFVDQTGCGNCSTCGAMIGFFEGQDNLMTAIMGNVAAAYNILQNGPFPAFTPEVMANARKTCQDLYDSIVK